MGKSPAVKAAKQPGLAKPDAGVRKTLPSPGSSKKATTDSKKFIDDLFAKPVKSCAVASEKESSGKGEIDKKTKQAAAVGTKSQKKDPAGAKDDLFGLQETERKKTEEGWNIYTEEELMMNKKGGNTDLCPFDCECCY